MQEEKENDKRKGDRIQFIKGKKRKNKQTGK